MPNLADEDKARDDEPLWEHTITSNEWKYWITEGHEELNSLEDFKVFVLA